MFDGYFWKDAGSRALKTFAQSMLAALGAGQVDILNTNLLGAFSVGAGAALVSLLMSLASEHKASKPTPPSP